MESNGESTIYMFCLWIIHVLIINRRQKREDALAKQRIKDEIAKDKAEREARMKSAYVNQKKVLKKRYDDH